MLWYGTLWYSNGMVWFIMYIYIVVDHFNNVFRINSRAFMANDFNR